MVEKKTLANRTYLLGCGLLVLVLTLGLGMLIFFSVNRSLSAVRYPGSVPVPSHTNRIIKRSYVRLDDSYRTQASLANLHSWYEDHLHLTTTEVGEDCISLGGSSQQFVFHVNTFITMCETSSGQIIYISRVTSLK